MLPLVAAGFGGPALSLSFDGDFGVYLFAQDSLDALLERDHRMWAASAGAFELDGDFLPFDRDEFEVSAIGLQMGSELFEDFLDFSFH